MGFFSQTDSFQKETIKAEKEVISSIIDTRMIIEGELLFEGKARIDGTIEGDIKGEHLVLSNSGKIKGNIKVSTFVCHGTISGHIQSDIMTICKGGNIQGQIESNSLTVEPGAILAGELLIGTKSSPEKDNSDDAGEQSDKFTPET